MASFPTRFEGLLVRARRAAVVDGQPNSVIGPVQILLATLSGAAGVIHLAMVPSHYAEWPLEGVGFALAGWFQLALAAFVGTRRPARGLVAVAMAVNAALIVVWAITRTAGLPFGPHAGQTESATFIDLSCVAMEAAFISISGMVLVRPSVGISWGGFERWTVPVAAFAVIALSTVAVSSPSARNHAAHSLGDHAQADDTGLSLLTNGHHHSIVQTRLDAATQAQLNSQLDATREVARRYPTVADAEAAGYWRAGPYTPGLGAHYVKTGPAELNADGTIDGDDALHPLAIIYDGTAAGSRVAGFMYYSISATEPQGFAGSNDFWHYHENLCVKFGADGQIDAPFGPDNSATTDQCASVGGKIITATQWMAHVWTAPAYDNIDGGVFAEINPRLMCADGTYYQLPVDEWSAHPLNSCRAQ